ncbi:MAG: hypothetical protein ACK4QW_18240 [Alphaproteobacteria bacterium]
MGHTQAATTKRYAHLADDPLRAAAGQFGAKMAAMQVPVPEAAMPADEARD